MHENRIQHAPRVSIEAERNVADTENCLNLGQLLLDALHRGQGLDSRRAVVFLPCSNRQSEGVEDYVDAAEAIFFRRQFVDAVGNGDFLVGGQGHAVFVDGQRNHGGAVAPGHGQDF